MTRQQCPAISLERAVPELVCQWHPTKNGALLPSQVSQGSNKKVWWLCNEGHEWQAVIASRANGIGCPICANRRLLQGFNDLATTRPDLAQEWHHSKNGDLTPSQVMAGSGKRVWWQCRKGHAFQSVIEARANGASCPYCSGRKILSGENDLKSRFPDIADEWHPTKNADQRPEETAPSAAKRVWWQCAKCRHEWITSVNNRTSKGSGCPVCAKRVALAGLNDLETLYPDLAAQWHPTKNGTLKPTHVTRNSNRKVWWQCNKGHEWQAVISERSDGTGCPVCWHERRGKTSKIARAMTDLHR